MPYTPPPHRSPASSVSNSPDVSRRSSFQSGPRPSLPRSASYLNKHRRTQSVTTISPVPATSPTVNGSKETKPTMPSLGGSLRQSPPPAVDRRELIPKGALISPPESATSGSDEDEPPEIKSRRNVVLKDLREAVSQMSKAATPPPSETQHMDSILPSLRVSLSTSALSELPIGGRKNGHMRSATEPHASILKQRTSLAASEEEADDDLKFKPQMVRKKSGELVRPALRGNRRPSSMPGTPVFSKAVHFDSHLEHVRHFLQVDRPLAVSAGSSPVENYDSDAEYPFLKSSDGGKAPPFEWELATPNFPHDSLVRRTMPARLEKVWLSNDQKSLLGSISVANLAFHKSVVCRFTMDYWKTVSEVSAEYSHEIRPREGSEGRDRFTFTIKLSDMADLESKTLFLCIRYTVNGQKYWDNNNSTNFQVDFKKKPLPQNGKHNFQGAASKPLNGLPRTNRRQSGASTLRPLSMPASLDAFGNANGVFKFDQPIHEYLGESDSAGGLRFKSKSSSSLASDNLSQDVVSPSGAAFSNRYDFGASLNAAVKAAKDTTSNQSKTKEKEKDTLYMKRNVRGSESSASLPFSGSSPSGLDSPASSLPSVSYEELVNRYCFVCAPDLQFNLTENPPTTP
ncbi:protein phosphatase regulatory subunit Gac1, putative [Metarhizium acridum CQMa 102]|uniref:Protein phosphatase regulatory subunit Gac1, putative n=1 Tax=Metarhizium acridum (strain CQMa 102) TaxID=655827 RepID=E9DV54_METAQ|nr:protein phosphatase regulatory subunit Gac1, putative [Metarhizium acridum CQMa 102]EFY92478.1 protein phosphatase regulatory subunit Gac1, putative [Metarhizium acridum CQMa 102]